MNQSASQYTIVVGVDGSEPSENALRWAVDEAKHRRGRVVAVHAWQPPVPPADVMPGPYPDYVELLGQVEEASQKLVADVVAKVVGNDTTVPVEPTVVEGSPASVLIDAAENADLVVVASRGHGGFVGLLLGSVSQKVVNHAPCSVIVHREAGP